MDTSLLDASLEQLDARLGAALSRGTLGSRTAGEAEQRQSARRWFEANVVRIQACVCGHPTVQAHCSGAAATDRVVLLECVAQALSASSSFRLIPTDLLAARILHVGLAQMCAAAPPQSARP